MKNTPCSTRQPLFTTAGQERIIMGNNRFTEPDSCPQTDICSLQCWSPCPGFISWCRYAPSQQQHLRCGGQDVTLVPGIAYNTKKETIHLERKTTHIMIYLCVIRSLMLPTKKKASTLYMSVGIYWRMSKTENPPDL